MERHASVSTPFVEHSLSSAEEIQQVLIDFAMSIRAGKIDDIMEFYAFNIVAADMMPPLKIAGAEAYKRIWEICFTDYFQFPVNFDFVDQSITVDGDIAFTHSLVHMSGLSKDKGEKMESWLRNTICLKRMNDTWKIVHEHNSVPIGEDGQGMMNLKPEKPMHH